MPTETPRPDSDDAAALSGPHQGAGDIAAHLDIGVIGKVCRSIGVAGYRSVLESFLADASGRQAALLAALDRADLAALQGRAHALKGAAASLGLTAVRSIAERLECDGESLDARACAEVAAELRVRLQTTGELLQQMGFA
ncbi:MAG: Hpt domain-containing protein [Burkholderiaceae bacterium]|nr:Hpt domain-containing protein [Burkholderiaceae bacterium]